MNVAVFLFWLSLTSFSMNALILCLGLAGVKSVMVKGPGGVLVPLATVARDNLVQAAPLPARTFVTSGSGGARLASQDNLVNAPGVGEVKAVTSPKAGGGVGVLNAVVGGGMKVGARCVVCA